MSQGRTINEIASGEVYESTRLITEAMIQEFARATGDTNPLHLDEAYARKTPFKTRIAHGMLSAGIISAVLGTEFPGLGTVYLSQTLRFQRPVYIGDTLTVKIRVLEVLPEKNRLRLETLCLNQRDEVVVSGEALVMPPQ